MNTKSANLIAHLRLAGFKERKGVCIYTNFIIHNDPRLEICIKKATGNYYFDAENIYSPHNSGDEYYDINENTLNEIIGLWYDRK